MIRRFDGLLKIFKSDLKKNQIYYFLIFFILLMAFIIRVWRVDKVLDFNFDQGRDALVIADILKGNLVLIGPTTGIEGIFLGPFYYYFLAPGYLLGQGNPVVASYWQTSFIILGFVVLFFCLRFFISKAAAFFTTLLMTFSFFKVLDDRWLSNPSPSMLFTPLLVLFLTLSFKKPNIFLPLAFLSLGVLLQLEAASSFFFVILALLFLIIFRRRYNFKSIFYSFLAFFITLIPQLLFELRHNFLLTHNLLSFLGGHTRLGSYSTFKVPNLEILNDRINLFATVFFEKLKLNFDNRLNFLFVIFVLFSLYLVYKNWSKPFLKVSSVLFFGSLIFFLFYQGNFGRIYTYYFIPVIPLFFIFVGLLIDYVWRIRYGKFFVVLLVALFLFDQHKLLYNKIQDGLDGETTVALGNETAAVRYVLQNAGEPFNVDVYIPPVIPYPYTYLFEYEGQKMGKLPAEERVSELYTIHEVDLERPQREKDWLLRQAGIGRVLSETHFGGVKVEKRLRLKSE